MIRAHGLGLTAPSGWEVRIRHRRAEGAGGGAHHAVLHAANFALPPGRGDFGGGAVELMSTTHALVCLLEYERSAVGTALFARPGVPRILAPQDFSAVTLQRLLPRQAGTQAFCNEAGRAFCLYVVLGGRRQMSGPIAAVNRALAGLVITPA